MRWMLIATFLVVGFSSLAGSGSAKAQGTYLPYDPYKWCAVYGGRFGGGASNCGFRTLEQCRLTVSGTGGFCEVNSFYNPGKRGKRRY